MVALGSGAATGALPARATAKEQAGLKKPKFVEKLPEPGYGMSLLFRLGGAREGVGLTSGAEVRRTVLVFRAGRAYGAIA